MSAAQFVALAISVFGVAGVIFTALSWRRNDTTAIVAQQDTIMAEMRGLNEELRHTTLRLREERDTLQAKLEELERDPPR